MRGYSPAIFFKSPQVSYLVQVGYCKSVGVKVLINGNDRLLAFIEAEIAQLGRTAFDHF